MASSTEGCVKRPYDKTAADSLEEHGPIKKHEREKGESLRDIRFRVSDSLTDTASPSRANFSVEQALTSVNGAPTRSPSPSLDLDCAATEHDVHPIASEAHEVLRLEKMQRAVRTLLECIGEDTNRDDLLDTPLRYAKALVFMTKGYQINVKDTINKALFSQSHNDMVIVKNIDLFSLCEHHLVPFTGKIHIGYIPNNIVIGLSKLARIAEIFSRRLQIQERLTRQIAHAVEGSLKPRGVAVVVECSHLCMVMRGVEKTRATTLTSCMLGCFESESDMRVEFMDLIGVGR